MLKGAFLINCLQRKFIFVYRTSASEEPRKLNMNKVTKEVGSNNERSFDRMFLVELCEHFIMDSLLRIIIISYYNKN